jgi:hypothetical protein
MQGEDVAIILVIIAIKAAIVFGGAYIAHRKNRSALLWGILCLFFNWIALLIIICLPKVEPQTPAEIAAGKLAYDRGMWTSLVASDPALAASVAKLRPYGERYVDELAAAVFSGSEPAPRIAERLLAKARAETATVASGTADPLGRNVETIFQTARGPVALLKDARALAPEHGAFKFYESLADYRTANNDHAGWDEITDPAAMRQFFAAAREPLEAVNATRPG